MRTDRNAICEPDVEHVNNDEIKQSTAKVAGNERSYIHNVKIAKASGVGQNKDGSGERYDGCGTTRTEALPVRVREEERERERGAEEEEEEEEDDDDERISIDGRRRKAIYGEFKSNELNGICKTKGN
jgi:hypothetical protein